MSSTRDIIRKWEKREGERDEYEKNRIKRVDAKIDGRQVLTKDTDDSLAPRHQVNCANFRECSFDYKCRNFDPAVMDCIYCPLHKTNGICHKKELHTDTNMGKLINRPSINLDEHLREVMANEQAR